MRAAWQGRGWWCRLLWPVAWCFGLLGAVRRWAYRQGWMHCDRLPVPVIVVGNVVVGGCGKTPLVLAIVEHLQAQGRVVGVVSRGYGRRGDDFVRVTADADPAEVGDEPLLIHRRTGAAVVVGARRVHAARMLLHAVPEIDILVCDDGLQHLALCRDVEIAVFDDGGVGNGWLLPAGPLREPWPRAVDLVVHTGMRPAFAGFRAVRSLADEAVDAQGRTRSLSLLAQDEAVQVVVAIAQPQRFLDMLQARGIRPATVWRLPDHDDLRGVVQRLDPAAPVVCTEKDAVKLWTLRPNAWAVRLLQAPEPAFWAALDAYLYTLRNDKNGEIHGEIRTRQP
ncbi:tetraacyldisaccharide 4'-kinase [Candidatus Symbiobacter mobilis CR]|uniref:Tetraacyldisaccharide 4'-kinase n=2 Tax=Candidatus Symbiobacter TaxID=1436289 RepID=U5NAB5_9BURK|nr:tetraacyldisaccharide 4'-kinase [Candidatus Symbiobacter mobilis]AGX88265.1 tetraacyldisaccharide 4'-kinase [Candidatus Symbiobacter mobilis CR]